MPIGHCNTSLIRFLVGLVTSVVLWLWTYVLSEFCTDYVRQRSSPVWKRKRSSTSISHWRLMASSVHGGDTEPGEAQEEIWCERSVLCCVPIWFGLQPRAHITWHQLHTYITESDNFIWHTCHLPMTNSASRPKRKKERKTLAAWIAKPPDPQNNLWRLLSGLQKKGLLVFFLANRKRFFYLRQEGHSY
jgi:hypothetical protein